VDHPGALASLSRHWAISAIGAKRSLGTSAWWKQSLLRGGIAVLTLAAVHFAGAGPALRAAQAYQAHSVLLGAVGAVLVLSIIWALPLVLFAPYFIYSARREEELLREQFPGQYPDYMQRTKMIVPFVL
jgi:protein-S-isoprenylcysteine O-methyltransferase Ste14